MSHSTKTLRTTPTPSTAPVSPVSHPLRASRRSLTLVALIGLVSVVAGVVGPLSAAGVRAQGVDSDFDPSVPRNADDGVEALVDAQRRAIEEQEWSIEGVPPTGAIMVGTTTSLWVDGPSTDRFDRVEVRWSLGSPDVDGIAERTADRLGSATTPSIKHVYEATGSTTIDVEILLESPAVTATPEPVDATCGTAPDPDQGERWSAWSDPVDCVAPFVPVCAVVVPPDSAAVDIAARSVRCQAPDAVVPATSFTIVRSATVDVVEVRTSGTTKTPRGGSGAVIATDTGALVPMPVGSADLDLDIDLDVEGDLDGEGDGDGDGARVPDQAPDRAAPTAPSPAPSTSPALTLPMLLSNDPEENRPPPLRRVPIQGDDDQRDPGGDRIRSIDPSELDFTALDGLRELDEIWGRSQTMLDTVPPPEPGPREGPSPLLQRATAIAQRVAGWFSSGDAPAVPDSGPVSIPVDRDRSIAAHTFARAEDRRRRNDEALRPVEPTAPTSPIASDDASETDAGTGDSGGAPESGRLQQLLDSMPDENRLDARFAPVPTSPSLPTTSPPVPEGPSSTAAPTDTPRSTGAPSGGRLQQLLDSMPDENRLDARLNPITVTTINTSAGAPGPTGNGEASTTPDPFVPLPPAALRPEQRPGALDDGSTPGESSSLDSLPSDLSWLDPDADTSELLELAPDLGSRLEFRDGEPWVIPGPVFTGTDEEGNDRQYTITPDGVVEVPGSLEPVPLRTVLPRPGHSQFTDSFEEGDVDSFESRLDAYLRGDGPFPRLRQTGRPDAASRPTDGPDGDDDSPGWFQLSDEFIEKWRPVIEGEQSALGELRPEGHLYSVLGAISSIVLFGSTNGYPSAFLRAPLNIVADEVLFNVNTPGVPIFEHPVTNEVAPFALHAATVFALEELAIRFHLVTKIGISRDIAHILRGLPHAQQVRMIRGVTASPQLTPVTMRSRMPGTLALMGLLAIGTNRYVVPPVQRALNPDLPTDGSTPVFDNDLDWLLHYGTSGLFLGMSVAGPLGVNQVRSGRTPKQAAVTASLVGSVVTAQSMTADMYFNPVEAPEGEFSLIEWVSDKSHELAADPRLQHLYDVVRYGMAEPFMDLRNNVIDDPRAITSGIGQAYGIVSNLALALSHQLDWIPPHDGPAQAMLDDQLRRSGSTEEALERADLIYANSDFGRRERALRQDLRSEARDWLVDVLQTVLPREEPAPTSVNGVSVEDIEELRRRAQATDLAERGILNQTAAGTFNNMRDELAQLGLTPREATEALGGVYDGSVVGARVPTTAEAEALLAQWALEDEGSFTGSMSATINRRADQIRALGLDPAQFARIADIEGYNPGTVGQRIVGEPYVSPLSSRPPSGFNGYGPPSQGSRSAWQHPDGTTSGGYGNSPARPSVGQRVTGVVQDAWNSAPVQGVVQSRPVQAVIQSPIGQAAIRGGAAVVNCVTHPVQCGRGVVNGVRNFFGR